MTTNPKLHLWEMPKSLEQQVIEGRAEAEEWRLQCLQAVQVEPVVELASAGPYEYSGTFVIKLSDTRIYWVNAVDHGWDCDEPGEEDDDGNVIKESLGSSFIETDIIDLLKTPLQPIHYEDEYHDDSILGIVYAIQRARVEGENITEPGHYWDYVSWQLEELEQFLA